MKSTTDSPPNSQRPKLSPKRTPESQPQITISEHGRASVMIIDVETARRALQSPEDHDDAVAAQEAAAAIANGEPTIPLVEIADELGLELPS
jgi:hypothetical protein